VDFKLFEQNVDSILRWIPEGDQLPGTIQVSQKDGMQTMDMALQNLVGRGMVTKEEAQAKSMNPNLFASTTLGTAAGAR
jgi:Tfp pilus assembly pilus retraction ATPase PilT